jgi:hypothetical protein
MEENVTTEESLSTTEEQAPVEASTAAAPAVDYKSEAEKYRRLAEQRLEAVQRMQAAASRRKEEPREQEEDVDTSSDVLKLVDERLSRFQTQSAFDAELEALTDNPDERELVRLVYENDLKVSPQNREDVRAGLRKALAIANLPRLESQLKEKAVKEIKQSIAEDRSMSAGSVSGSAGRQPPKEAGSKLSPGQSKFMDYVNDYVKRNQH